MSSEYRNIIDLSVPSSECMGLDFTLPPSMSYHPDSDELLRMTIGKNDDVLVIGSYEYGVSVSASTKDMDKMLYMVDSLRDVLVREMAAGRI